MHRLAATAGTIDGGATVVDLAQAPADLVVLTAADSELATLARAHDETPTPLNLASLLDLQHHLSVDLYVENTLRHAKLVVLRLLGGASYWAYGLERLEALATETGLGLVVLPGDRQPDAELMRRSTLPLSHCENLRRYLAQGGAANARSFLAYCRHLLSGGALPPPAATLPDAGIYRDTTSQHNRAALFVFYRSVIEGAQTEPIDALIDALARRGIATRAIHVVSLKDTASLALLDRLLAGTSYDIVLNATGFALAAGAGADPLQAFGCPVLQVVLSGSSASDWQATSQGLSARDLAMNVVLPELDGRILTRAISFKETALRHQGTQSRIVTYRAQPDRVEFTAELAANWVELRRTQPAARRIAIVLANYPNRDSRIANGVGYDTPASTLAILQALATAGYGVEGIPADGNTLIRELSAGPTNAGPRRTPGGASLALADYETFFASLPADVGNEIMSRWGEPRRDPFFADGAFHLPVRLYGHVAVAIQPARGYNIDPKSTYHDPALVPPHGYLAFYAWLRQQFRAHAVIHNGKHGNLEWLPGKATALSRTCYPEVALGPLPQLYPFIVNDPGEGTQAKRRTAAVIIDHLTPPLTRAETYGPLRDLEALVDEYYLASGLDRRRRDELLRTIFELTSASRLDLDAGLKGTGEDDLQRLDSYLCDLKESQIRDGLHVLGSVPGVRQEAELLVALTRVPRGLGEGGDRSLIRALSADLGLDGFDPLACAMAGAWNGPRPEALAATSSDPWRSNGDTVERLELLAAQLVEAGAASLSLPATSLVLEEIERSVRPALRASGAREIAAVLAGLDGRPVAPGPSGAPTRGRLDVLPTGRNFYSIDNRTVPTPAAWTLGSRSAEDLLTRHFQDTGAYPTAIGLSAWGTSNMRTGGDDIAQALALIGAKPVWEPASWRVSGFEIVPLASLGRPRVDVTLRISGFFRDAFPLQIELFDRAARAVGALEEDEDQNPLAARMRSEGAMLQKAGLQAEAAAELAGHRVFGSRPGAYGAGLQTLIDERLWQTRADLASAYVAWGAHAYGARARGEFHEAAFLERLRRIEAVVHNQDNREHDLLDSDDYYQFEGGMAAAVETASGRAPRVYHNDHSRPEHPRVRTLEEEIGRVVRARVVNPKWIEGVKRHGYKGAFEIAATVDYMFAFAAATGAVKSHHFDLAFDAYIADDATRRFLAENNPEALKDIAARLAEACGRGLWAPRLNSAHSLLEEMAR